MKTTKVTRLRELVQVLGLAALGWVVMAAGPADASPSPVPIQPKIALSVPSGGPGTTVTMTGTGFPPLEVVAIYLDTEPPFLPDVNANAKPPGPVADAQGAFQETFVYPGSSYDVSGHVKPTTPGLHAICGDTTYPGSTQRVPARACTAFEVVATASPTPGAGSSGSTGTSWPELIAALAVLIVAVVGMYLWIRRSQ